MIRLHFIHICDYAFFSSDNKLNVIGVFDQTFSEGFPTTIPRFSVVTGISGEKGSHEEIVEIYKPDGTLLIASNPKTIEIKKSGARAHFVGNFLNIAFPVQGNYSIKIKVDGNLLDEKEVMDILAKPISV